MLIDPANIQGSGMARDFLKQVKAILSSKYAMSDEDIDDLLKNYSDWDVDPLELALTLHRDPEDVASELRSHR